MNAAIKKLIAGSFIALGLAANANATIYQINFNAPGTLDTTNFGFNALNFAVGASGTFASLTFDSNTNVFSLAAANNLSTFFAANTFIAAISFETNQDRSDINDSNVSGGGISNFIESSGGPDFTSLIDNFDVTYTFDDQVLTDGETVNFTITGFNPNCLTATTGCGVNSNALSAGVFSIRLGRSVIGLDPAAWALGTEINANGGTFAATSLPVPEPEIAFMMALGLGVLGFAARRNKQA